MLDFRLSAVGSQSLSRRSAREWHDRPHFSNTGSATFQLQVFASGPISARFAYADVDFESATYDNGSRQLLGERDRSEWRRLQHPVLRHEPHLTGKRPSDPTRKFVPEWPSWPPGAAAGRSYRRADTGMNAKLARRFWSTKS